MICVPSREDEDRADRQGVGRIDSQREEGRLGDLRQQRREKEGQQRRRDAFVGGHERLLPERDARDEPARSARREQQGGADEHDEDGYPAEQQRVEERAVLTRRGGGRQPAHEGDSRAAVEPEQDDDEGVTPAERRSQKPRTDGRKGRQGEDAAARQERERALGPCAGQQAQGGDAVAWSSSAGTAAGRTVWCRRPAPAAVLRGAFRVGHRPACRGWRLLRL